MLIKLNLKKLSRRQYVALVALLLCGLLGAGAGWLSVTLSNSEKQPSKVKDANETEPPFALQTAPPEIIETAEVTQTVDPAELQIWEIAARQALPPRKVPLTSPPWRIVGVTEVGSEKNVLLLFGNPPVTEIRKIGEKLPGGAKIVRISQEHLQISLNGQLMKLNLRKQ
jgi:hypothetical protein